MSAHATNKLTYQRRSVTVRLSGTVDCPHPADVIRDENIRLSLWTANRKVRALAEKAGGYEKLKELVDAMAEQGSKMLRQISPLSQVRDLEASVGFYRDKLGFQTGATDGGFAMIRRDHCVIFLAQKTKVVDLRNRSVRALDDDWCN